MMKKFVCMLTLLITIYSNSTLSLAGYLWRTPSYKLVNYIPTLFFKPEKSPNDRIFKILENDKCDELIPLIKENINKPIEVLPCTNFTNKFSIFKESILSENLFRRMTVLDLASLYGATECVKYILENGGRPFSDSKENLTIYSIASGNPESLAILEQNYMLKFIEDDLYVAARMLFIGDMGKRSYILNWLIGKVNLKKEMIENFFAILLFAEHEFSKEENRIKNLDAKTKQNILTLFDLTFREKISKNIIAIIFSAPKTDLPIYSCLLEKTRLFIQNQTDKFKLEVLSEVANLFERDKETVPLKNIISFTKNLNIKMNLHFLHKLLFFATDHYDLCLVKDLVDMGANVNLKNKYGKPVFHTVVKENNLEGIEFFVSKGVNIDISNSSGDTPMHIAAQVGNLDIMKFLIKNGADVNRTNLDGETPLYMAMCNGHFEVAEFLLSEIDNIDISDNAPQKKGLLFLAITIGEVSTIKKLILKGVNVNQRDYKGNTPLHLAIFNIPVLERGKEIVKTLVENGANINAKSKFYNSDTPLHLAALVGNIDVIQILLAKGADVNVEDNSGNTPLHYAAQQGNLGAIKVLINKGAKINAENIFKKTPAYEASLNKYSDVTLFLIENGADVYDLFPENSNLDFMFG